MKPTPTHNWPFCHLLFLIVREQEPRYLEGVGQEKTFDYRWTADPKLAWSMVPDDMAQTMWNIGVGEPGLHARLAQKGEGVEGKGKRALGGDEGDHKSA